ncbi:hypothetical protein HK097_002277, partial [Rhizophlyctis rosea]
TGLSVSVMAGVISGLENLKSFCMNSCEIGPELWRALGCLPQLERLSVVDCKSLSETHLRLVLECSARSKSKNWDGWERHSDTDLGLDRGMFPKLKRLYCSEAVFEKVLGEKKDAGAEDGGDGVLRGRDNWFMEEGLDILSLWEAAVERLSERDFVF